MFSLGVGVPSRDDKSESGATSPVVHPWFQPPRKTCDPSRSLQAKRQGTEKVDSHNSDIPDNPRQSTSMKGVPEFFMHMLDGIKLEFTYLMQNAIEIRHSWIQFHLLRIHQTTESSWENAKDCSPGWDVVRAERM